MRLIDPRWAAPDYRSKSHEALVVARSPMLAVSPKVGFCHSLAMPEDGIKSPALLHRHRFRQIPRFIDIRSSRAGGVVGEELQGDDVEDGAEGAVVFG